jgi:CRP/FNR family transcriptional regulator
MSWTGTDPALVKLDDAARAALDRLAPVDVPEGAVLFSPGDAVRGYVIVLSGRVAVHLVGPTGRDILLYEVAPGQACIQSTLGLLGGEDYTGEATAEVPTRLVLLPRDLFLSLTDTSPGFRRMVFTAFAERMQAMMQLIENVSFLRVEQRLAALILERAGADGVLRMTQAEMATAIGTAREVVSRRLDRLARAGILAQERGLVRIRDRTALAQQAQSPAM